MLSESGVRYDDPFIGLPDEDGFFAKYMTLARVLIAQGRRSPHEAYLTQALAELARLCPIYEKAGCAGRVIEILMLTSLALQAQGDSNALIWWTPLGASSRPIQGACVGGWIWLPV